LYHIVNGPLANVFRCSEQLLICECEYGGRRHLVLLRNEICGHKAVVHHTMNTQFKFGDDRLNGSKVYHFVKKFKMAIAAIFYQVCHQFLGHINVLHHIMNTQFKFGDDRLNGSKVTAFC
jgi:hypothetical protein